MTLGELIQCLEAAPQNGVVPFGFHAPHSYRGYYEQLAFEPKDNVLVSSMLADAKDALGRTFEGYKGGDFKMHEHTDVWLANYGCCGESIGPMFLGFMLRDVVERRPIEAPAAENSDG